MSIGEKIKKIDNKIKQNKDQYDSGRQTTKISALASGNVSKYELLAGKDFLPKKRIARKRIFEYCPLGK